MSQHGAMPAAWEETSFTGGPQGAGGHLDCPGLRQCAVRPDAVPGFQKMCRVLDTPFSTISTQRGPQKTCGVAALHRHVRDELLQVIIGDILERGERVPAVLVEGGSVRGQLMLGEEGGGGLRHVHAHAHAHCDVWAGAAWADLLYSLLCIPLY
jgi:hypothetical protein